MINSRVVLLLFNLILQIEEITAKWKVNCTDEIIDGNTILTRKGKQPDCKCVSDTGTDEKCPKDAVLKDDFCYVWPKNKLTYLAGRTLCQGMKGSIFGPKRRADVTFMYSKGERDRFWNGMNDMKREGKWVYEDGSPVTWSMWYPGEPNGANGGRGDEDCGVTSKRYWFDYGCASLMKLVCRIPTQIITDDRFTCVKSKGQNTDMKIQRYYGPNYMRAADGNSKKFVIDQNIRTVAHVICIVDKYEYAKGDGKPNITLHFDETTHLNNIYTKYTIQNGTSKNGSAPETEYHFNFLVKPVEKKTLVNGRCKVTSALSVKFFKEDSFVLEIIQEEKANKTWLWVVLSIVLLIAICGSCAGLFLLQKRKATNKEQQDNDKKPADVTESQSQEPQALSPEEPQASTPNKMVAEEDASYDVPDYLQDNLGKPGQEAPLEEGDATEGGLKNDDAEEERRSSRASGQSKKSSQS